MEIKVVLPLDGSEGSQLAIVYARKLLRKQQAKFLLLTSIDPLKLLTGYDEFDETLRRSTHEVAKRILEDAREELGDAIAEEEILIGRAGEQIVDFIERHSADLVIMATQNSSRLKRFLLGSVTNYVISHSEVPVLAIPIPK